MLMCVSAFGQYAATQSAPISIPDSGNATPYPSKIDLTKSNILGVIEKVTVTVNPLTHPYAPDLGLLLVGPNNNAVVLMGDSGGNPTGSAALNGVSLTFSDDASDPLPANSPLISGSVYRPTDNTPGGGLIFAPPAPTSGYATSFTNAFLGLAPTNLWSLYVLDTTPGPPSALTPTIGSWTLSLFTTPTVDVVTNSSTIATNTLPANALTTFVNQDSSVTVNLSVNSSSVNPGSLTVTAVTNNLVTNATYFAYGGAGQARTVTISPNPHTYGTNTLTINVSDGIGTVSTNITLAVAHVDQVPIISLSTNTITTVSALMTTNLIIASVGSLDPQFHPTNALHLSARSSDSTIVSPSSVFFAGIDAAGTQRAVTVVPTGAGYGTATITVLVDNGVKTNSANFTITVLPVVTPVLANTQPITLDGAVSSTTNSTITIAANTIQGLVGSVKVSFSGLSLPNGSSGSPNTLTLTAPGGLVVPLINDTIFSARSYGQVVVADGATGSLPNNDNLTNTISIAPPSTALSSLIGVNPNGTWTLTINNPHTGIITNLNGWTLVITPGPTVGNVSPNPVRGAEESVQQATFTVNSSVSTITNITGYIPGNPTLAKFGPFSINGNNATLTITGNANQFGTNQVQVVAQDKNGFSGTNTVQLELFFVNHRPELSFIGRQVVAAGSVLSGVNFTVKDIDTPINLVTVRASSDNQKLIPDGNILINPLGTGSGTLSTNYSLTIFPIGTVSGSANITLTANDNAGGITNTTFNVFVQVPDFPLFAFGGGITINNNAVGSPYAATNPVAGLIGTTEKVKVTLFDVSAPTPGNVQFLLVGPTGASTLLMANSGSGGALSHAVLVFSDDASVSLPSSGQIASGTYKPTGNGFSTSLPAPAPTQPYGATLSVFANSNPNGNWLLFVNDNGSAAKGAIAGGFQVSIQTAPKIPAIPDQYTTVNQATNIAVVVGDNQPGANLTVTATPADPNLIQTPIATSISGSSAILKVVPAPYKFGTNTITVNVSDSLGHSDSKSFNMGVAFANQPPLFTTVPADQSVPAATQLGPLAVKIFSPQGNALDVSASSPDNPTLVPSVNISADTANNSGNTNAYTLSLIPFGALTGTATIQISATDKTTGQKSFAAFKVTVTANTATLAFANTGAISIPQGPTTPGQLQQGAATPYPSPIKIAGLGGAVSSVQVAIVGLNHQHTEDLDIMLVGPDNKTAVMLMAHAGAGGGGASGLRLTFNDSAASAIPQNGALSSQTYQVADYSGGLVMPAPAPPRPYGANLAAFNGLDPNGNWQLFVLDDTFPTGGSIDSGWVLYLQTKPGIVGIAAQTTPENTPLPIPLTITSASTDPTNLLVSVATSGDFPTGLVDPTNLVVTGIGANRTLTITPTTNLPSAYNIYNTLTNRAGTNLVTVTAADPINHLTNSVKFPLTVSYVNQSPYVKTVVNTNAYYVDENTFTTIAYNVSDVDSTNYLTNIVATSSNQGLLANSNIVVTMAGGVNKVDPSSNVVVSVKVTPTANTYGSLTLSLTATDGNTTTTNQITLNVNHIWQRPTISHIVDQPAFVGQPTTNIAFTVGSVEVPTKNLLVYATSDTPALVPNSPANIVLGGSGDNRTIQLFPIGNSSGSALITVFVTDLSITNANSTNSTSFTLNATAVGTTFANLTAITTSGSNKANIYPSTINIAANSLIGATYKVDVTIPSLAHNAPANLDILVVEEGVDLKTNAVVLMSGAGGTAAVSAVRLQFDDGGATLPTSGLTAGTYIPANYTPITSMPAPAPANSNWNKTLTGAFGGLNPNGQWKLYVNDRGAGDVGNLAQGWQLLIQTAPTIALAAGTLSPFPVPENGTNNLTLNLGDMSLDVTNLTVTAHSDNQVLIPDRNVTFASIVTLKKTGPSGSWIGTVAAKIAPAVLQFGTANVTFTVARSDGATSTLKLPVTVTGVNVPPTISRLDPVDMPENGTSNITVIISDADSPLSGLVALATSTNESLISSTSLAFGANGSSLGTNRLFGLPANNGPQSSVLSLQLKPTQFQVGTSLISVIVNDTLPSGTNNITNQFVLTVHSVVFPPYFITSPSDQSVAAGGTLANVKYAVGPGTPAVSATTLTNGFLSSDKTLVDPAKASFTVDASGTNRTVTIVAEKSTGGGTATVTLIVGDPAVGSGGTSTAKFNVTVRPSRVINLTNSVPITIVDNSPADVYPSQIQVSNLKGPIQQVTATLRGFTHSFASDVGVLLVGPTGQKIVLMNNLMTGRPGPTNVWLTFDQTAAAALPVNIPVTTGSYLPLDNSGGRVFSGTAAAPPYTNTLNAFTNSNPNGTWSLYVQDFVLGDSGIISNGWSLGVTTLPVINGLQDVVTNENQAASQKFTVADDTPSAPTFNFSATSDNQAVVTNNGVVFSGSGTNYTVTVNPVVNVFGSANITVTMVNGDGQTVTAKFKATFNKVLFPPTIAPIADQSAPAGTGVVVPLVYSSIGYNQNQLTLTFQSSNPTLVPVGNMKLSGTNLLISPVGIQQGSAQITVIVNNPDNLATNTSFKLTVGPSLNPVFAQSGAITINDNAAGTPYPSVLNVSGLSGNISKITATMVGFGHAFPSDVSILLVGPQGQSCVLMSRAGGSVAVTNTRLTFDDAAPGVVPQFSLIADGTYLPSDYKPSDTFFPPVPSAPYGHTLSVFNGTSPNGAWNLYVQDDQAGQSGVIAGGWLLSFITSGPAISPIGPTNTPENVSLTIPFTVSSSTTSPTNLIVTATNSNDSIPGLIAAIKLSGTGASRSLLITPGTNLPSILTTNDGTSTITITVSDGTLQNSLPFLLTVNYVNQPPKLTGLADKTTAANVPITVNFTVSDVDSALSNLVFSASTTDTNLGTATLSGSLASYSVTYKPSGKTGTNTVNVIVVDGSTTSTNSFKVVSIAPLPPVISAIAAQTAVNTRLGALTNVAFTVNSVGSTNLVVTGSADNTALVPQVTVAGSGTNFTATIRVAPLLLGTANISIRATNEFGAATNVFGLTVRKPVAPALLPIAPQTTPVNVSTNVTLGLTSTETPLTTLLLTATDTNTALLKNVTFAVNGSTTVATLNVVSNMVGFDLVTIKADDGFTNVTQSFTLTVTPTAPITMAAIGQQTTVTNTPAKVALTVTSKDTAVTNLTFKGTSTNAALVSGITFSWNGQKEVATVNLFPNRGGVDFVTISATDGFSTAVQSFGLIVTPTNTVSSTPATLKVSLSGNQLTLNLSGSPGGSYAIQTSANLSAWTTVTNVVADASGKFSYTTPVVPAVKLQFVRAKSQ
jgi:subtilisin-like proprotein convertase family protein